MFERTPAMYEHVNALVRLSLQLRKELESNRTDSDRAQCVMGCKTIRQHTDALGALIDATFDQAAFLKETFPVPGSAPGGIAPRPAAEAHAHNTHLSLDTSPLATIGGDT